MGAKVKFVENVGLVIGVLGGVVPGRVVGARVTIDVEFEDIVVLDGIEVGVNVISPVVLGVRVIPSLGVGVKVISPVEVGEMIGGLKVVVAAGGVKAQMRGGQFGPSHGFL